MLDQTLRPAVDFFTRPIAHYLMRKKVSADQVTWAGFAVGLVAWILLSFGYYIPAFIFILGNRICDAIDGDLARLTKTSDWGGFLDIVLDFIFYAGTVFFFILGRPEYALMGAFLLFSFMGTSATFLTFAIFAQKNKIIHFASRNKAFYYLKGLTESSETIIFFTLICFLPDKFILLSTIFGCLCWVTIFSRIMEARRMFGNIILDDNQDHTSP